MCPDTGGAEQIKPVFASSNTAAEQRRGNLNGMALLGFGMEGADFRLRPQSNCQHIAFRIKKVHTPFTSSISVYVSFDSTSKVSLCSVGNTGVLTGSRSTKTQHVNVGLMLRFSFFAGLLVLSITQQQ